MADDERQEPVFDDPQFRQKRKHGRYRVVDAPQLEGPVADTHAHLQLLLHVRSFVVRELLPRLPGAVQVGEASPLDQVHFHLLLLLCTLSPHANTTVLG